MTASLSQPVPESARSGPAHGANQPSPRSVTSVRACPSSRLQVARNLRLAAIPRSVTSRAPLRSWWYRRHDDALDTDAVDDVPARGASPGCKRDVASPATSSAYADTRPRTSSDGNRPTDGTSTTSDSLCTAGATTAGFAPSPHDPAGTRSRQDRVHCRRRGPRGPVVVSR